MDRKSRYVIHSGHFGDEMVCGTIDDLYEEYAKEDALDHRVRDADGVYTKSYAPIPFILNSEGGSPFAAMALADSIVDVQSQGCEVQGYSRGQVASAAIFPWLVCTRRTASKDALFMVHGATDHGFGDLMSQEVELAASKLILVTMAQRLADRTHKDLLFWKRMLRSAKPNYYTAEQALALGLVDSVV